MISDTPGQRPVRTFVFDASVLSPFARSDRLDVLGSVLAGRVRCVTTRAVRQEILAKSDEFPLLASITTATWLSEVAVDGLDELGALVWWIRKLGATQRDRGEATIFAYAQTYGATAIIDDGKARRLGRKNGVDVHGTLWLLADACHAGSLSAVSACTLVDVLASAGARLPCTGASFRDWAAGNGLRLDPGAVPTRADV